MSQAMLVETHHSAPVASAEIPHERLADGALLHRFLVERDEAAFEELIARHGPRVLRVCRQWLGNGQDAEDAFQATFIVLVNRAGELRDLEQLGAWLSGVARRVAGPVDPRRDDLCPILRAEVDRLPEKYRKPIELCYWEGLSSEQAARELGCPTGTLKWRLARARATIRGRIARFGITLAAVLMGRIPRAQAADVSFVASRWGRATAGDDVLPAKFVQEIVSLSILVRESSHSFMKVDDPGRKPGRASKRGRRSYTIGLLVLALFLGLPALCMAVPAVRRIPSATFAAMFPSRAGGSCH